MIVEDSNENMKKLPKTDRKWSRRRLFKQALGEIKRTVNEQESENFIHITPLLGVSDHARRAST